MEKTNKASQLINRIFDILCNIYDNKELYFGSITKLTERLQRLLIDIALIEISGISEEIWNATSQPNRDQKVNDLFNTKFDKLLTWRPNIFTVKDMDLTIEKDLFLFFEKQASIGKKYNSSDKNILTGKYKSIGHNIIKFKNDLNKEKNKLVVLLKQEAETKLTKKESNLLKLGNIKLNPDKQIEFATLLTKMIAEKFFIPVDDTVELNENDIIASFQEILHTIIENIPTVEVNTNNKSEIISTGKMFPDFLLHPKKEKLAEAIKTEFSAEKGKMLRLMLKVLESQQPPLITIGIRQATMLYAAMSVYFDWNIGTRQSIFNYKMDDDIDKPDLENVAIRVNHILSKL